MKQRPEILPQGDSGAGAWTRRGVLRLGGGIGIGTLLAACGGGGSGDTVAAPDPVAADLQPPAPAPALPPSSQTRSVLKRTSFGVHKDTLAEIESVGIAAFLERQLAYESIDTTALEQAIAQRFPSTLLPAAATRPGFPGNAMALALEFVEATLFRHYFSPRQLYEVMVEFWTNHFAIDLGNGPQAILKPVDDREVIRPHALGNFRTLLKATARSPAMLFGLDNFLNKKDAPNENYARELLELHTLGIDGGYTEQDIKEVARCFTGWGIHADTCTYQYLAEHHDTGAKTVLGHRIAAGGHEQDGEAVLDRLAASSATARHIATKLCRRFIADEPPADAIAQVSRAYLDSDGDIRALLRALFATRAFLDTRDAKIDRPVEFVGQLVRTLDLAMPADNGWAYAAGLNVLRQVPCCWPAPDGYPDVARHWASGSGLLNRWRTAVDAMASGMADLQALAGDATTVTALVDALTASVLARPLTAADRQTLIGWLAGRAGAAADSPLSSATITQLLPSAVGMLISSPYFQLR